jgi:hypothetical protein
MPACVRVDSGISVGTTHWIDRAVLRIGSDPQCDICLPSTELDPHALTLEFRGGAYRVYNRCTLPVRVGNAMVSPGANAEWHADEAIHLPGDVRVSLVVDGDQRPSPRLERPAGEGFVDDRESLLADAATSGEEAAAIARKSKSSLIQIGIIGACVVAVLAMLMIKNGGGDVASAANRPTFNEIVQDSLNKDEAHRAIVHRLQYAQAALVRGNNSLARERFLKLRDQLVKHVDSLQGDAHADAEKVLSYVEYRLGGL